MLLGIEEMARTRNPTTKRVDAKTEVAGKRNAEKGAEKGAKKQGRKTGRNEGIETKMTNGKGPAPEMENGKTRERKRKFSSDVPAQSHKGKKARLSEVEATIQKRHSRPRKSGVVLSLGQGDTGQLGLGEDIMERAKPALVKSVDKEVTTVAAGGMHTLCLSVDGKVWSFGCNDEGALGRKTEEDEECYTPGVVDLPNKVVQISAGDSHSAALDETGAAYYWGTFRDSSGSFGLTVDGVIQKLPVPLAHHLKVSKITSGTDHVALLTTKGQLYTLGCGEQGQLGRIGERFAHRGGRHGPKLLLTAGLVHTKNRKTTFIDVWAGSYNTLALTSDKQVIVCGLNNYHQLGIAKELLFRTMVKSDGYSNACKDGWDSVAFGQHHALALDGDGKVYAVGRGDYGRLGLGEAVGQNDAEVPTVIPGLKNKKCVQISCGTAVSFAITDDGDCYSWGMCTNGQLGHVDGDKDAWEPVKMIGKQLETRDAIGVAGGGQHTVLLAKDDE